MTPNRLISIAILLTTAAPLAVRGNEPGQGEVSAKSEQPKNSAIDDAMREFVDAGKASGVVTLVAHDRQIVHLGAVGLANLEKQREMKPSNLFAIASMTKPIVATAVMMLRDEDKLDLDDPVSHYLPEFADMKIKGGELADRSITIGDVLTHTSGLAGEQIFSESLEASVQQLAARPLAFQPGTKWQYSPGLNVAGRIIEVVAEQPLDDFLQERIFEPLGMKQTTFYPSEAQRRRLVQLYAPGESGESLVTADHPILNFVPSRGANASGGLVSSARDLFRFYQMVLNEGRWRGKQLVSKNSVAEMTSCQTGQLETGFTPGNCWGLGWCVVKEPQGVTEMLSPGTFGHGGAFGTQGWVDPKTGTIYVLMIQRTRFGNSDASDIRKTFQRTAVEALGL